MEFYSLGKYNIISLDNVKYQIYWLVVWDKIFSNVLLYNSMQNADPQCGANYDPRDMIWAILIEVNMTMLHAKSLVLLLFDKKIFKNFTIHFY